MLGGRALRKAGGGGGSGSPPYCGGQRSAPWTAIPRDCAGARDLSAPRIAVRPPRRTYLQQRCLAGARCSRAAGQIASLRLRSHGDPLIEQV